MKIAVCINRVPDTGSRIDVRQGIIDSSRFNMVMNPYDEYALEEAVRIKEQHAGTTVSAFSAGGRDHYDVLRKALAVGADAAYLVEGGNNDDSYVVAASLGKAIKELYSGLPDLVFCGRESSDCNRAQVPLMLGEMLGIAAVSAVTKLELLDGELKVWRETEGGMEEYALRAPALLSAEKGLNIPRKTNIKGVMKAKKQPVIHLDGSVEELPRVRYEELQTLTRDRKCRFLDTEKELVALLHAKGGL